MFNLPVLTSQVLTWTFQDPAEAWESGTHHKLCVSLTRLHRPALASLTTLSKLLRPVSILQNLSPTATSAYQLPMLSCQPTLKGKILCSIFKYIEQRSSLICLCKGWLSPKFTVILFLSLIETWKSDACWVQILSLYLSTISIFGKSLHLPETRSPSM